MDGRFGRALGRLNSVAATRLADSLGAYQHGALPPASDLSLQVDRGVGMEGAEQVFQVGTVVITWLASQLAGAARGGVFLIGTERFVVEDIVANDGQFLSATCVVQR